jgi:membrane protease YdiL (CAAX protease family)
LRIPLPLAWLILLSTFGTAALLRSFHERTPVSPLISPIVGSALFAAILLLLLVTARERRNPETTGPGVRLGLFTPLMLMLLIEKWFSLGLYPLGFFWLIPRELDPRFLDILYRGFAGVGLILVCIVVGSLSRPTMRKVLRRARPVRWPIATLGCVLVVGGCYALLGGLGWLLGGGLRLELPRANAWLFWIIGGQAVLAFGEELYYRGVLLAEVERVAPRMGLRSPAARRWTALVLTSALFGLEHLTLGPPWGQPLRELAFSISLGLLFGILIMVSTNLYFVAGVHAWINWLLLGAAPYFVDANGRPALPAGTYIGLTLILAFGLTFLFRRWRDRRVYREPNESLETIES